MVLNPYKDANPVVIVIATSGGRTDVLMERALRSVYLQEGVIPHHIYIVDDNPKLENGYSEEYGAIRAGVRRLWEEVLRPRYERLPKENAPRFENYFHTSVIPNTRTVGCSGTGAWNTAAMHALQYTRPFLAILDDDDEWEPNHLATCLEFARPEQTRREKKCVAVVSGMRRVGEPGGKTEDFQLTSETFTRERLFEGNPGFQGSNIFMELRTFWDIGGFDESMRSGTDRDLGIRLLECVKRRKRRYIAFTDRVTVIHHAGDSKRVSNDPGSKQHGLDTFYRKYWHTFRETQRGNSLKRARELFNYKPPATPPQNRVKGAVPTEWDNASPFNLHIGTISDSGEKVRELLKSFLKLYERDGKWINYYTFHILDNSGDEYEIGPIVDYFRIEKGLKVALVDRGDAAKLNIAQARTRLQQHILAEAHQLHGNDFVTWIVDDDSLFQSDLSGGKCEQIPYFQIIAEHRSTGVDALLGMVSDAPPLPFTSTIRTQLLDFYYNLTNFAHANPDELVGNGLFNAWQHDNRETEEFYYDLAKNNFQHLERPLYWQPPFNKRMKIHQAFRWFLEDTSRLGRGVNVFRKLTYPADEIGCLKIPSIHRGGNTIIYNPDMLSVRNYTPDGDGYNRRSDFNWAIINRDLHKRDIRRVIMPLQHSRVLQDQPITSDLEKFQADVQGMLFYRLLQSITGSWHSADGSLRSRWLRKIRNKLNPSASTDETLLDAYKHDARRLTRQLKANGFRARTLCYAIEEVLTHRDRWWHRNRYREQINDLLEYNLSLIRVLLFELGKRKQQKYIGQFEASFINLDTDFIKQVCKDMEDFSHPQ